MSDLIEIDPNRLGGKPIIKGTRISVEFLLELIESDNTIDEILEEYPHLSREAVESVVKLARQVHESISYEKLRQAV